MRLVTILRLLAMWCVLSVTVVALWAMWLGDDLTDDGDGGEW